jgi:hypothetical protein
MEETVTVLTITTFMFLATSICLLIYSKVLEKIVASQNRMIKDLSRKGGRVYDISRCDDRIAYPLEPGK